MTTVSTDIQKRIQGGQWYWDYTDHRLDFNMIEAWFKKHNPRWAGSPIHGCPGGSGCMY